MLTASLFCLGLTVDAWQLAPDGGLLDDVLVTCFPAQGAAAAFVRLAVFDPAQNHVLPDGRARAHDAVAAARRWLRDQRDPLVALHGAAAQLHDPCRPVDANPLTTLAWVDVVADRGRIRLLGGGRMADAELGGMTGGRLTLLSRNRMLRPDAEQSWDAARAATRSKVPAERWAARRWHERMQLLDATSWANPPLGLSAVPHPELLEGRHLERFCGEQLLVATDGAELDQVPDGSRFDLASHLQEVTGRAVPAGQPHAHGDIAVLQVTAS
jgi:hypothetical protein